MKNLAEIRRKNLVKLIEEHGATTVANRTKRSIAQISDMQRGKKSFGEKVARAIEQEWDASLPPGWLDDEGDEASHKAAVSESGFTPVQKRTDIVTISRYDTGGAMGNGVVLYDQPGVIESWEVTKNWIRENVRGYTTAENLCIVTGLGDSMKPMFNPGDPLLVDRGVKTVPYESPYFFRIGDAAYVKRLQRVPMPGGGMMYRAISENPAYPPIEITDDMDFEVFGRVVQVWRREDF